MKLIQLVPEQTSHDIVQAVHDLLEAAHGGQITGIVFAATIRGGHILCDSAGTLYRDPMRAIGACGMLTREMVDRIHRRPTETAF